MNDPNVRWLDIRYDNDDDDDDSVQSSSILAAVNDNDDDGEESNSMVDSNIFHIVFDYYNDNNGKFLIESQHELTYQMFDDNNSN